MPDTPDYSKFLPKSSRYPLQDMGEMAVRMGSFSVYDRRGEVVYYDDFEGSLSEWQFSAGGGTNVTKIVSSSMNGSHYALSFSTSTPAGYQAFMERFILKLDEVKTGIEWDFTCINDADYIQFGSINTGKLYEYKALIEFRPHLKQINIYDENNSPITIDSNFVPYRASRYPLQIKLIFDLSTGKYSQLRAADRQYDLSKISIQKSAAATDPRLYLYSMIGNLPASTAELHYRRLIVTSNEP